MYIDGHKYIAPGIDKDEYLNLHLKLRSSDADWKKAIGMFEARIQGRFFDQIEKMMDNPVDNGFAIMALNCLLVETLLHFKEGETHTSGTAYKKFLSEKILGNPKNDKEGLYLACLFYKEVRCGILHGAETGNKVSLSAYTPEALDYRTGYLYVSVDRFTYKLKEYFEKYLFELRMGTSDQLREMFIRRMNGLCRKDD